MPPSKARTTTDLLLASIYYKRAPDRSAHSFFITKPGQHPLSGGLGIELNYDERALTKATLYLIRPPQQFRTIDSRYNQLVYDLAPAGWRALERNDIGRSKRNTLSGPWLHRFMTSCITASIELATLARGNISYISQSEILRRADAELRCAVEIADPISGYRYKKDLIPDALFGLRYHTAEGDRFRFFVVEADRATEPATSGNWNRKSFERNLAQYEAYVACGVYREHLGLTAPLLVLNVLSDQRHMERMINFTASRYPRATPSCCFRRGKILVWCFVYPIPIQSL